MYTKRHRRITALCICLTMVFGLMTTAMAAPSARLSIDGNGSAENPYKIYTIEQFYLMEDAGAQHFLLMNDLDMGGGEYTMLAERIPFVGTFDGNGYTIRNITITKDADKLGLFSQTGKVGQPATIKNLRLENVNITSNRYDYVGAISGYAQYTTFENCVVEDSAFSAYSYIGGIAGYMNYGIMTNNQVKNVIINGYDYLGGLTSSFAYTTAVNNNTVKDISITGYNRIGGLAGNAGGIKPDGNAVEEITIDAVSYIGGLFGYTSVVPITNSHVNGYSISGSGDNVGGFAGYASNASPITNSYANVDVSGGKNVGGLVGNFTTGNNTVVFDKNYFTGNVTGEDFVGGIVGNSTYSSYSLTISNSFAIGTATATNGTVAGIGIGTYYIATKTSYAAMTLSGNTKHGLSYGNPSYAPKPNTDSYFNSEITQAEEYEYGMLTVGMRQEASFPNWDFRDTWEIEEGVTYPYLWELKIPDDVYIIAPGDAATGVTLNPTTLDLIPGQTYTLEAIVTPANASNKAVTYKSNMPGIAKVNASTGVVTAVSHGTATITATTHNGKEASCVVTVTDTAPPTLDSFVLDPERTIVSAGDVITITPVAVPSGAVLPYLNYISTDNSILKVEKNSDGTATVTALADGFAVIIAYDNSKNQAAFSHIFVGNNSTVTPTPGADRWADLAPMQTARMGAAVVALDNNIYVIGGRTGANYSSNTGSVEIYNTVTNTWDTGADMPTPRFGLNNGVAVNGEIYVIGGTDINGNVSKVIEAYNPATDTWRTVDSLSTGRANNAVAAIGNKIYVVGGSNASKTIEIYDTATNTWSTGIDMPNFGQFAAVISYNGKIYTFASAGVFEYDPSITNSAAWKTKASMPLARNYVAAVNVGDYVYVFGGRYNTTEIEDAVQVYHIPSNTWTIAEDFSILPERASAGAVNVNGSIYLIGGTNKTYNALKDVSIIQVNLLTPASAAPTVAATTILNLLQDIIVTPEDAELAIGDTLRLNVSTEPTVTEEEITFTTNDNTVAIVDAEGIVTAVAPGTAIITVQCGTLKVSCTITVIDLTTEDIEEEELPEEIETEILDIEKIQEEADEASLEEVL